MKKLILLPLLLSLSTCDPAHAMGRKTHPAPEPSPIASVSPTPVASPSAVPVDPTALISVGKITDAKATELPMLAQGVGLANAMLFKPCFKQWVTAATYTETNGLTSAQIYQKITTEPSSVDVEMYYQNNKVVGFEYDPFDGVVHMNRKFVNTASMVADNLLHEDRGHSLGFHHYGKFSTSVPYGMNYAYEGCSVQQMRKGTRNFRPPGLRYEIRHRKGYVKKKHAKKKAH